MMRESVSGRAPRLLFVCNVAWFFLSHRLPLARAARAAGYEVHVAAGVESEQEERRIRAEPVTFHRLSLSRGSLNPLRELATVRELRTLLRTLQPDLVHNIAAKPVIYGTWLASRQRVRAIVNAISGMGYVFTGGGGARRLLRALVRAAYAHVLRNAHSVVIFQNEQDRREFVDRRVIAPEQAVIVRGSGVDLDDFRATPEPGGVPLVLLPARLLRDKGVMEFGAAARRLRDEGVAAAFAVAGGRDPANPASLTDAQQRWLSSECGVTLLGHREDVPALMRDCHVVCLPSYREGLPKALIEACASARAIVATDVAGCRAVVEHDSNGLLVPPMDERQLASALRRLIEDPVLRRRMGAAGRRRAEKEFDVRLVVDQTLALYDRLLDRKAPTA